LDIAGNARFHDSLLASDTGFGTAPYADMGAYEAFELRTYLPLVMRGA
jgi:hypothetical protein